MDVHTPQQPDTSCIYAVVQAVESDGIRVRRSDLTERRISFMGGDIATRDYLSLLQPGNNLHLLDVVDDGTTLHPRFIVAEPDFLVDVSLLAECCRSFGHLWQLYFASRMRPRHLNRHILLGNAANLIFDEMVNADDPATVKLADTIKKIFTSSPLEYAVCPDIDATFFADLAIHHEHLLQTVKQEFAKAGLSCSKGMVEPTFISPALGLRGRLDFLQTDGKQAAGIELKSGKKSGGYIVDTHRIQLSLYQLMLHYSLGIEHPDFYALYSRYAQDCLVRNHLSLSLMQQAIGVRNRIVLEEFRYTTDCHPLRTLTKALAHPTYEQPAHPLVRYVDNDLHSMASALHKIGTDEVSAHYFDRFYRFLSREQYLSKVSRSTAEHVGATVLWQVSIAEKRAMGCIMAPLCLQESHADAETPLLRFSYRQTQEAPIPKFRDGDIVLLYRYRDETSRASDNILFRGVITNVTSSEVLVRLRDRQQCHSLFVCGDSYVLEADYSDMAFKMQFAGLFAFLQMPKPRRRLLLGQGDYRPRMGTPVQPAFHYDSEEVEKIVATAAGDGELYLLMGPPGTGKTSVALMGMVREIMASPHRNLLLVAYTNRAVDEICSHLEQEPELDYIRIGMENSCATAYRYRLIANRLASCSRRDEVIQNLTSCRLYVASLVSLLAKPELFELKQFDTAIVDEASQLLETQLLGLLAATDGQGHPAINRFVLIGDHKQLPAIVLQEAEESRINDDCLTECGLTDCRMSLFERLYRRYCAFPQLTGMLSRQWRMHPDIADFASTAFYGGRLKAGGARHQASTLPYRPYEGMSREEQMLATSRMAFIDIEPPVSPTPETAGTANTGEALAVARVVEAYYKLNARNGREFLPEKAIGIITPYRNQIAAIRQQLEWLQLPGCDVIRIDTVERFQGSQNDVIIFSCAVTTKEQLAFLSQSNEEEGVWIDRKLNVAVTRAREQIVIVGYKALLETSPVYAQLLHYIARRGTILQKNRASNPNEKP